MALLMEGALSGFDVGRSHMRGGQRVDLPQVVAQPQAHNSQQGQHTGGESQTRAGGARHTKGTRPDRCG